MSSNAQRGARAKSRTKKYLEGLGYQVGGLEMVRWIVRPGRTPVPIKHDQFASDLLAVNRDGVLFVQVKSGAAAIGGTFPDARRKFTAFPCPLGARQVVIAWPPRARQPRIVDCGVPSV